MSELFEDDVLDESNDIASEDISFSYTESLGKDKNSTDVRRKLEELLEARRLREELEDFLD